MQGVPPIGKEGEKGGVPQGGKGAPRRKETEENGGRKGGTPCKGRSAAKMEEEFDRRVKEESRGTLWKERPRRGAIPRIRVVRPRDNSDVHRVQRMWEERKLCGRQQGPGSAPG